jgi:Zn-dependent protease/CBS domain-containing protein
MPLRSGGVRIARIAGIEVRLDWSLIVIFWLIMVNLSMGPFAAGHPDWSPGLRWGMGAIAAVLFVLSILAHELAHALVGRRQGVEIAGITLFMFGGMARTRGEPVSPRAELLMTIVGPLTSVALGLVALVAGAHLAPGMITATEPVRAFGHLAPLATVLLWLGPVNIVIGLFNLVPAFPLDGGRILRAALWASTGDLQSATRRAAGIGRAFALLLVFAGIAMIFNVRIPFFGSGLVPGLWIAFIGWFLNTAAAASYTQVVVHDLLKGIPVSRLMQRTPVASVGPDLPVSTFIEDHLMAGEQRAFPVIERERLMGIVTPADVRKISRADWPDKTIRGIMAGSERLAVVAPDEDAAAALEELAVRDVEQLPVVDQSGRFLGLLRRRDILRWLDLQSRGAPLLRDRHV